MHVVVIGARGRLGIEITNTAADAGAEVTAVARAPSPHWRSEVDYHQHDRDAPVGELRNAFHGADAVIVAAPVSGRTLHSVAIDAGCHVVDVTINGEQIDSVLQLDEHARAAGKAVIMAAGLAPGLTGLIGKAVRSQARADAAIDVCLTQSANGTAGEHGAREMLDMLTLRGSSRWCHLLQHPDGAPQRARAFALPTPESSRAGDESVRYFTRFDKEGLNSTIRFLSAIRAVLSPLYRTLSKSTARRKGAAEKPDGETVVLTAVATDANGEAVSWQAIELHSDYGATATVAVGAALEAASGRLPPGAGLLSQLTDLSSVLAYPTVERLLGSASV